MDIFDSTVETRVHDVILALMDSLVNPTVKRAKRSTNASFLQDSGSVIPNPEKMVFSGNRGSLHMTALSRLKQNLQLNRIAGTCGIHTVEAGDLFLPENKYDRHFF